LISVIPAEQLDAAKAAGMARIVRRVPAAQRIAFIRSVAAYSADVAPLTQPGGYISRVAVAESARGRGLGAALVQAVRAMEPDRPLVLHVRRDNTAALRLYERLGFRQSSSGAHLFPVWAQA
jgi:ribosomal protein S18 acetylase RimI-like enzyme